MMKSTLTILCALLFAASAAHAAQLYRWVDSKGNVEWRDTPPPATVPAKNVEQRRIGGNVIETSEAPYSVQLATKNHPVTFWSSSDCGKACEGARAHLTRRGIPFAEKNPTADFEGFKKVSPANEVPILQVGTITLKGYLDSEWDSTLDAAGYPRSAPAGKPKPVAAAPKPAADAAKPAAPAEK
jgi:Domain of unknown function (DUF4124)